MATPNSKLKGRRNYIYLRRECERERERERDGRLHSYYSSLRGWGYGQLQKDTGWIRFDWKKQKCLIQQLLTSDRAHSGKCIEENAWRKSWEWIVEENPQGKYSGKSWAWRINLKRVWVAVKIKNLSMFIKNTNLPNRPYPPPSHIYIYMY